MSERAYTAQEACRLAGCDYRTLDHWCRANVIRASIQSASGKGSDRRFSATDVRCLRLVTALRHQGLQLAVTIRFADCLRMRPELGAGDVLLVRDGKAEARRRESVTTADFAGGVALLADVPMLTEVGEG